MSVLGIANLNESNNERVLKRKKYPDTNGPFCDDKFATICPSKSIFILHL